MKRFLKTIFCFILSALILYTSSPIFVKAEDTDPLVGKTFGALFLRNANGNVDNDNLFGYYVWMVVLGKSLPNQAGNTNSSTIMYNHFIEGKDAGKIRARTKIDITSTYYNKASLMKGINEFTSLQSLNISGTGVKNLTRKEEASTSITNNKKLQELYCSGCSMQVLSLEGCTNLQKFTPPAKFDGFLMDRNDNITSLDLSDCSYFTPIDRMYISIKNCSSLSSLKLPQKDKGNLEIICNNTALPYIDVSESKLETTSDFGKTGVTAQQISADYKTFADGKRGFTLNTGGNTPSAMSAGWQYDNGNFIHTGTDALPNEMYYTLKLKDSNSSEFEMMVGVKINGTLNTVNFTDTPESIQSQSLFKGDKLNPVPSNQSKPGYTFTGWSDGTKTYMDLNDFTMPNSAVNLRATWELNTYNLTFNAGDGEFSNEANTKTIAVGYGNAISNPEKPTKPYYSITGWKNSSVTPVETYNEELQGFTMPDKDVTLEAVWEINKHNINFNANGGTFGGNIQVYTLNDIECNTTGATIKARQDFKTPTKASDTLEGWSDSQDGYYKENLSDFTMPDNEITLTAIWAAAKYNLVFDLNGGKTNTGETTIPSQQISFEGTINTDIIPEITTPGYNLSGWKYGDIVITDLKNFTMPANDVTLTAQWQLSAYNLTLYKEKTDTQAFKTMRVKYNENPNLQTEDIPTKTGYSVIGWSDGTTTYNDVNLTSFTMPYKDLKLTAVWKANSYELVFDANGGEIQGTATQNVEYNTTPTSIPLAKKEGATFSGWLNEKTQKLYNTSLVIDGGTEIFKMPDENVTLKAQWSSMHNLTFKNGDAIVKTVPLGIWQCPTGASLPDVPTKDGYNFDGWTDGTTIYTKDLYNSQTSSYFKMPDEPLTLTAEWTPKNYKLSFKTNGGTPATINSQTVPCGSQTTVSSLTKNGYNHTSWEYILNGSTQTCKADLSDFTMPAIGDEGSELTLTAIWEAHVWELTFNTNGGSPSVISSQNVAFGSIPNPIPENPIYAGYKFTGWSDGNTTYTNLNNFKMPDNKVTLTAVWAGLHKLDFLVDGTVYKTQYLENGQHPVAIDPPTKDGYKFIGWKDSAGTTYQNITDYSMPDNDISLTATWEKVYSLKVYLGDNDATPYTTQQLCAGDKLSSAVDNPSQTGSTFNGWVYKSGGSGSVTLDATFTMPANDVSIVATWTANKYTLSFDINDGSGAIPSQSVEYGKHPQNVTSPTKTGYRFAGWQCGTDVYSDISSLVMPASNTTVIAKWSKVYKLSLYLDNTSASPYETYELASGESPSAGIDVPIKRGYKFTHWKDQNGNTVATTGFNMPAMDMKLIAYWEEGNYTLSFNLNGAESPTSIDPITLKYQEKLLNDIETPKKTGMAFAGWKEGKYGTIYENLSGFTMPDYDATLVAQFNSVDYTLTLNANNGNLDDNSIVKLKYGESPNSVSEPVRAGYKFKGWQQGVNNIITDISSFKMPDKDITLTAQWELNSYTLSFDTNGSDDEIDDQTVKYNAKPKAVTAPEREGYEFEGWAYGGEVYKDVSQFKMPAEDTTVVAQWNAVYALTFNTKGGTPKKIDTVYLNEGETTSVTAPTKSGYVLEAWTDTDRNKTYSANLSDFSMPSDDTTLTAQYSTSVKASNSSSSSSSSSGQPSTGESTQISYKFVLSAACVSGLALFMLGKFGGEEGRKAMKIIKTKED